MTYSVVIERSPQTYPSYRITLSHSFISSDVDYFTPLPQFDHTTYFRTMQRRVKYLILKAAR